MPWHWSAQRVPVKASFKSRVSWSFFLTGAQREPLPFSAKSALQLQRSRLRGSERDAALNEVSLFRPVSAQNFSSAAA
jgi:hypothetical protein